MFFVSQLVGFGTVSGDAAAPFDPLTLSPYLWLRFQDTATLFTTSGGSTNVSADGDPIGRVEDQSGNSRHFTQATAGARPTYKTGIVNSRAVARFDGTDDYWDATTDFSALTEAEVFIVVAIDADPPGADAQTGLWRLAGNAAQSAHFPYTDGTIYDSFGTDSRKTTGNPAPSLAAWRLYNVVSASGEWTSFIDGTQFYTTGTNTVAFHNANLYLGRSNDGGGTFYYLDGDIAEVIMFSSKLGSSDKDNLEAYFASRYALTIA